MPVPSPAQTNPPGLFGIYTEMPRRAKVLVWVGLNIALQAFPLWFLYHHTAGKGAFWDFVNCTFLIGTGLGMFVAAYADAVAERCPAGATHWITWTVLVIAGTAALILALYQEVVLQQHANEIALCCTAIAAAAFLIIGTLVKSTIWNCQDGE